MDLDKVNEIYRQAVQKKNAGDLKGALEIVYKIKDTSPDHLISYNISKLLIDIGLSLKDENTIINGIELLKKDFKKIIGDKKYTLKAYINLANVYYSLSKFKDKKNIYFNCIETELDLARFYYKKALKYKIKDTFLKSDILVDYGNCFYYLGSEVEALECYEKALELNSDHAIASGKKGIILYNYARLVSKNRSVILIDAYKLISKALESEIDPEYHEMFSDHLKNIESYFPDKKVLENPPEFPKCQTRGTSTIDTYLACYYLKNELYLNICNFCQKCYIALGDSAFFEIIMPVGVDMDINMEKEYKSDLSEYLKQIRQNYMNARILIAISQYHEINQNIMDKYLKNIEINPNFIDSNTENSYNCNFSGKDQLIIYSFINFYNIFDKIACFINKYFKFQPLCGNISFKNVWYSKWNTNCKKRIVQSEIENSDNEGLNALFEIHKDFEKKNYKKIDGIKTMMAHNLSKDDNITYIRHNNSYDEILINETLKLAKIARNAIIYLLYFVENEKNKKSKEIQEKYVKLFTKNIE